MIIDSFIALTPSSGKNPDIEVLLEAMKAQAIERSVIMPMCPSTREEDMVRINDLVNTEVIGYFGIEGFATVNPRSPFAQEELDRSARELRLKGLSIDPTVQGFHFTDDEFWSLLEVVHSLETPVFCRSANSEYFNTDEINETVISFPKVPFIFSNMGLEGPGKEFTKVFGEGNVFFETSDIEGDYIVKAIEEYGAERVVFGSGFAGGEYPVKEIEKIRGIGLRDDDIERILWGNMARILGLSVKVNNKGMGEGLTGLLKGLPFFKK